MENTTTTDMEPLTPSDFYLAVRDGRHADAAIIASVLSDHPELSSAERQEWIEAAHSQFHQIPASDGVALGEVWEFLHPTVSSETAPE